MSRDKKSSVKWHWPATLMLAYAVFLAGLAYRPVPTIDGAVRASLARNIVTSGQWFPLTYQGHTFVDHPPLFVWSMAASFKYFGLTDFVANLPMHLCAFLLVALVYIIGRQAGMSRGVAFMACVILCSTRDFVLSSVRGYIEPMLELCVYAGLGFALKQTSTRWRWPSVAAALCMGLAWFAKGPPAMWPTLFIAGLLIWNPRKAFSQRWPDVLTYAISCMILAAGTAMLINRPEVKPAFDEYLHKQVLGSALQARNNAQTYDPFFFFSILRQYYWPWLPFLVFSFWGAFRKPKTPLVTEPAAAPLPPWIFLLFGAGFFAGFSIVKWKFWYYIAPAYPAFALLIAGAVFSKLASVLEHGFIPKTVFRLGLLFSLVVSCVPIKLFHDRVPEVTAFAPTISRSPVLGPVWFLHSNRDHNLIATSGEWSFGARSVDKVENESRWAETLKSPAWIITSQQFWQEREQKCEHAWCRQGRLIQSAGDSALILY